MNTELDLAVRLFIGGCLGHVLGYFAKATDWHKLFLSNNKGEEAVKEAVKETVTFTPEQQKSVDHIVEARLSRERAAKADYEELKKFREETLSKQDAHKQKELEEARKYDEAKKGYEGQVNQYKDVVSKKDQEIIDLKIGHNLTNEISKQNGFIEETIALLKSSAVLIDGNVFIKTKDANNIDVQLPIGEGVKRFLESKPHLVKSNFKSGGGSATGSTGDTKGEETLTELNNQMSKAISQGDEKAKNELNKKIRAKLNAQKTT